MTQLGVTRFRQLIAIPILAVMIVLAFSFKTPQVAGDHYHPIEEPIVNPLAGWAVDARDWAQDERLDVMLVYARITWAEVEPEPDEYAFEQIEEKYRLNECWAAGKRVILRFVMDVPGELEHMDIPQWLYDLIGGAGTFYQTTAEDGSVVGGFAPDYSNILLRQRHLKVIDALAKRYNEHDGVAYVEVGSVGHAGEWWAAREDGVDPLPVSSITRNYEWHYTSRFLGTPLLMRRPYNSARRLFVGLYNPDIADEEATWDLLEAIRRGGYDDQVGTDLFAMPDFWRTAPAGAHLAGGDELAELLSGRASTLRRLFSESRLTYACIEGNTTDLPDEAIAAMEELTLTMGYRLWVRSADWDAQIRAGYREKVSVTLRNDGVAPMYAAWPVELALAQDGRIVYRQRTDLAADELMPGDSERLIWLDVPADCPVGTYELYLAIVDPATGQPGVRLAMQEAREDGWAALGQLEVYR